MNYTDFESQLCNLLKKHGWIASVGANRQDTWINWTTSGKEKHKNFIAEVNMLVDYDEPNLAKLLREFAIYHKIIKPTRLESITNQVKYLISDGPFVLIACSRNGESTYSFFQSKEDEQVYRQIEETDSLDKEVVIIEMSWLEQSNVPRLTPLGAKGYWGKHSDNSDSVECERNLDASVGESQIWVRPEWR